MIHLIFYGLLSLISLRQPASEILQTDPVARQILDRTSREFRQLQSLRADLLITVEMPESKTHNQQSEVFLQGDKYKLVMDDEVIICDGNSVWRYLSDMNEVQINDYQPADNEITPANIFNIYENDFYFAHVGSVTEGGRTFDEIDLSPMNKDKSYFKVRVWIDRGDHLIGKMKVFDKNGTRYIYTITRLEKNVSLPEGFFRFREADYPGVWVEDLRF